MKGAAARGRQVLYKITTSLCIAKTSLLLPRLGLPKPFYIREDDPAVAEPIGLAAGEVKVWLLAVGPAQAARDGGVRVGT